MLSLGIADRFFARQPFVLDPEFERAARTSVRIDQLVDTGAVFEGYPGTAIGPGPPLSGTMRSLAGGRFAVALELNEERRSM